MIGDSQDGDILDRKMRFIVSAKTDPLSRMTRKDERILTAIAWKIIRSQIFIGQWIVEFETCNQGSLFEQFTRTFHSSIDDQLINQALKEREFRS